MRATNGKWQAAVLCGLLVCLAVPGAFADVQAIIQKTNGQKLQGMVRWLPATRKYVLMTAGGIQIEFAPTEVADIDVARPASIDQAVNLMREGRVADALPLLESIMNNYAMLKWDAFAAGYAAEAYLKTGDAGKALEVCDKIIAEDPSAAFAGSVSATYWEALLQLGRDATLRRVLDQAVQQGNEETSARAQIKRGDMQMKEGNYKDALLDGYLRTVVFFEKTKSVQAEALYKASKCFDELGQTPYAERMRKRLMTEFPDSEYTEALKSGI